MSDTDLYDSDDGGSPEEGPGLKKLLINGMVILLGVVIIVAGLLYIAVTMPGTSVSAELPPLTPEQTALKQRLQQHVYHISETIGERSAGQSRKLDQTADYIQQQLESYGYIPTSRSFGEEQYRNIEVDLYGREKRAEIIVIGAHYDTTWLTPGADDNASGIAGLLEIANSLKDKRFPRTIRFIAFANEEVPNYRRAEMGSMYSAKRSFTRSELVVGMISLEMIGYFPDQPGSQRYPSILSRFYPDQGNFLAFVSNLVSRDFMLRSISHFREQAVFPSEGLIAPEWLERSIRRSDHASYWYYDYPALMITDTANFRNRNYHRQSDRHDTLDYDSMARLVGGLTVMLERLAQE